MLTAGISAAIVGVLSVFGVSLSAAQIGGIVVAVKIVVVVAVVGFGVKLGRKRAGDKPSEKPADGGKSDLRGS